MGADVDVEEEDGSDPGECIEAEGSRVVDPHWFNADPGPAFFLIEDPDPDADLDPVPDPGFDDQNLEKKLQLEIFLYIFLIKTCNLLIPRPP